MRYLNKIVFINSAHIPYAEIKLDGNVHFIGTQGVGKSTLLRSILFFYNVDKSRLGIRAQDKQKSYDEFYFPYPNSYIIYEVFRENGKFFVMTFLSNGRVAFRIVDCPYEKRFFVEDDNCVRYEWGRISEQIGTRAFRSNIIRGYEEFRDIIYGNVQNVPKDLRRFSLMESSRYQNVPRTIQNIFLNQSLESRVIKDTIIDSMDFAGDSINLDFYREHVKDFRQQYEDIWKWYKKERNGKVKVKTDADNVIDKYALCEVARSAIKERCAQLNYGLGRDKKKLPQIEEELARQSVELARQKRLLGEEHEKYNKERDELKGKEAVVNDFLKQLKDRRQHYSDINIDAIMEKAAREKELNVRKQSLVHQEHVLTDQNQSVKMRYEVLQRELDNSLMECRLQSGQRINAIESQNTEEVARIQMELSVSQNGLNSRYLQKLDEMRESMLAAEQDKSDLKLQKQKLCSFNPFEKEMDDLSAKAHELEERKHALTVEMGRKQQEINSIKHEAELRRKELESICEKDLLKIEHDKEGIRQEAEKLKELLDRQKGSFIEWLDNNVAGWQDSIGKIVEDEVLYSTSLVPQMAGGTGTLYGVRIELRNLSKVAKTPEEIQSQINVLGQNIRQLDGRAVEIRQKLDSDIKELERMPNAKLKALRLERINIEAELRQIPVRIERYKKEAAEYQSKLQDWRRLETDAIVEKLGKLEELMDRLKTSIQQVDAQKRKETEGLRKFFDRRKREIEATANQRKVEIEAAMKAQEAETVARKRELEAQMYAELKGLVVDVDRLQEIRKELQRVNEDLDFIERHKPDYYAWQKDKREYFDVELPKREEKKRLLRSLEELQHKFDLRREKKEAEIRVLSEKVQAMQQEKERLGEAIGRVSAFLASSSCPAGLMEAGSQNTQDSLSAILDSLRDGIIGQQQRMEDFRRVVEIFKSNFSPQNTFHFRTEFNAESDYTDFASELNEFISNNKIEEYRMRTSRQYASIIKRIAREVGDLNQHNAEIKAAINEINRDFRENNFAGVIKEIELRAVESSDRLMQQFLNIKRFDEEHGFDIGSLNLFSTEETQNRTNEEAVKLLMNLIDMMDIEQKRDRIALSDTFKLEFKVKENDNDTNWVEKLSNVGSDGTDILVKSMVNRTFRGFLVNCYEPVPVMLSGNPVEMLPEEGTFVFIYDFRDFSIPNDVVVIGVENGENFRYIRKQRWLFDSYLPKGTKPLFVSRYPQEQSRDLLEWLLSIHNPYIHFGDLDLAGVQIYLTEYYRHLGERASFLIPWDYEDRILHGSRERYDVQYGKFGRMKVSDTRLVSLVECIHRLHRGYDQEGFIREDADGCFRR